MDKLYTGSRYILGLIFIAFGANGLIYMITGHLVIPIPPPSDEMKVVMSGLFATKYLMPTVKVLEVVAGLFLISNKCVNLAITLLGPIIFNILFLHIFVDTAGLPLVILITALWIIVLSKKWPAFKHLFCQQ